MTDPEGVGFPNPFGRNQVQMQQEERRIREEEIYMLEKWRPKVLILRASLASPAE
jgi:hypothetical protein